MRFRDTKHLRQIVEETSEILCPGIGDGLYFVHDEAAKDGEELVETTGSLKRSYLVNDVADSPLTLKGDLKSPFTMVLPLKSKWNECNLVVKGVQTGELKAYKMAQELATELDANDDHLFSKRIKEAYTLMRTQQTLRKGFPELFPGLLDLCPDAIVVFTENIKVVQKDYIKAKKNKPLIYGAPTIALLEELRKTLPEFGRSIAYIDPKHDDMGVYCSGPLSVQKGFLIVGSRDVGLLGSFPLKDYNFHVLFQGDFWSWGTGVVAAYISVYSEKSIHMIWSEVHDLNTKHPEMSDDLWGQIVSANQED